MTWIVETLNETVDAELSALPNDMKAKLIWISNLIAEHGLEKVGKPYVKYLEQGLWKIRLKGKDGISRALYITAKPKRIVVVRVFIKKTQKTPRKEIKLALSRESRNQIMTLICDLHQQWLKAPKYQAGDEAQRPEFEVASAIIAARSAANLTQQELAELMSAKQSLVARLEAGEQNTTIKTLNRIAEATNTRLQISFLPQK